MFETVVIVCAISIVALIFGFAIYYLCKALITRIPKRPIKSWIPIENAVHTGSSHEAIFTPDDAWSNGLSKGKEIPEENDIVHKSIVDHSSYQATRANFVEYATRSTLDACNTDDTVVRFHSNEPTVADMNAPSAHASTAIIAASETITMG